MKTIVFTSVTNHMVIAGIYNFLFHYPFPLSSPSTSFDHGSLAVTQTFIPEGSRPLVVPPGMGCCTEFYLD